MSIENGVALANENAGTIYHGRTLRRMFERERGWDVRVAGGLATSGIANGGVSRYFGAATTGDFAVIQRGAGANMSVDVLTGGALVGGTESATQGVYFVFNDATVNVVISASDPTNARIDVIGLQIRDKEYSGGTDDARLVVITGTPAGSPVVPTLPADFLTLAHVAVAANAGSIVTGNITDKRVQTASKGGIIICTAATRPTVNLWPGMVIIETDTVTAGAPICQVYDGASWVPLGQFSRAWTVIADTVLGGNGPLAFAAIPATFTHLQLLLNVRGVAATINSNVLLRLNSDASAVYSWQFLAGTAAAVSANSGAADTSISLPSVAGSSAAGGRSGHMVVDFLDYKSPYAKSVISRSLVIDTTGPTPVVVLAGGIYVSGATISQMDLYFNTAVNPAWVTSSRATLIGIR